jgi:chromosome segregation ATPase
MTEETTSIRTSFLVVSILSLLWLSIAVWVIVTEGVTPANAFQAMQAMAVLLAPVAALYALASALGNRERLPTLSAPDTVEETEARLSGTATRIEALRSALSEELQALTTMTTALEAQSKSAQALVQQLSDASAGAVEATRALEAAIPQAATAAESLRAALEQTGAEAEAQAGRADSATRQLADTLDALGARGQSTTAALAEALAQLEARAAASRAESDAGIRSIRGEADSLFEVLENTLVAKREALARQSDGMVQQLTDAYGRFETLAGASAEALAVRLDALARQADAIEGRLQAQASLTESLAASGERAFQLLDARLSHSSETSRTTLDRLSARVQEVSSELVQLTQPLRDTQGAVQGLETTVGALKETALQTVDVLQDTIPQRTVAASQAAETLSGELKGLVHEIETAHDRAIALKEPIAESREAIEAASAAYANQRSALESASQTLIVELQKARTLIGEVEEQTRDTSLSAATRLVDAMARVREVATQTTGAMREMLDGLLAEARESLSHAADDAMRRSFAEPIAARAREAETAAAAAAERTASSMAALANTLKLIEDRAADQVGKYEAAQQADLLASATLLSDQLAQASVSISSALGRPMDDADWAQWRKGERTLFNRRALALLDKREARDIKALAAADPAFAQGARAYVGGFEALIRRFESQSPALAAALLGSDQGRLAAALMEALDG